ncbi:hypothetical protein DL546_003394 [Coniochaeta pulveracea]|uniref:Uncharacterized protein n=1 Tax=Coniochaeta pulveracea TaxID=177199 RepID=A0A420XZK6_9PEZI|nr:hypothetical protein DL546_003394 [Coniochaeta pulveracea]
MTTARGFSNREIQLYEVVYAEDKGAPKAIIRLGNFGRSILGNICPYACNIPNIVSGDDRAVAHQFGCVASRTPTWHEIAPMGRLLRPTDCTCIAFPAS